MTGLRDVALLLTGFAGAFGRSEMAGLDVGDIYPTVAGDGCPAYEIYLHRSKTEGWGQIKALFSAVNAAFCPVSALREYIAGARLCDGSLFRQIRKSNQATDLRLHHGSDDGSIVGIDDIDGTLLKITNTVRNSIRPDLMFRQRVQRTVITFQPAIDYHTVRMIYPRYFLNTLFP